MVVPRSVTNLNKSELEEPSTGPERRNNLNRTCYKLTKQHEPFQGKMKSKRMNVSRYLQVLCSSTKTNSYDI